MRSRAGTKAGARAGESHVLAPAPDALEQGRDAYARRAWEHAYHLLTLADRSAPLEPDDLELLATSAYLLGRTRDHHSLLDRAHHAHLDAGNRNRSARCAFWLGLTLLLEGKLAQASGWFARSRRSVEGLDCVEHGYLLLPKAEQDLAAGEVDGAFAAATEAAELAERFDDADLTACARHLQGRALIRKGQVHAGLALLDEAMLPVITGELTPMFTGLIYCSVIAACQEVVELSRAREWTSALSRWCEDQPELVAFTATCLVHRAQIMQFRGAWPDAMAEAHRACERFTREPEADPPAAALYLQGEIHRLRGELGEAEKAYREAGRRGSEPQPGLALLRMAQGRTDAACAAIKRVLGSTVDRLSRTKLLPAYVEIMLAAADVAEAHRACREMEEIAAELDMDVIRAMAAHARGATELADGNARAAVAALRAALGVWSRVEAPYEAARGRQLIGLACRALGDEESCGLELEAARSMFERLGAAPDLARLQSLVEPTVAPRHVLTRRELQVLRLVAAGRTNKSIAAELSLSERTVDRHVSNILTKLDVPSRAAATAHAFRHKLL